MNSRLGVTATTSGFQILDFRFQIEVAYFPYCVALSS
jgi:hypothetical protein